MGRECNDAPGPFTFHNRRKRSRRNCEKPSPVKALIMGASIWTKILPTASWLSDRLIVSSPIRVKADRSQRVCKPSQPVESWRPVFGSLKQKEPSSLLHCNQNRTAVAPRYDIQSASGSVAHSRRPREPRKN